jgi:hypothetical protein
MNAQLSEEVRERIGVEKVRRYQVTARDVRRFAQAIGDREPEVSSDGRSSPAVLSVFMFGRSSRGAAGHARRSSCPGSREAWRRQWSGPRSGALG